MHLRKVCREFVFVIALFFLFSIPFPTTGYFIAKLKPVDIVVVEQPPTGKDKAGNREYIGAHYEG